MIGAPQNMVTAHPYVYREPHVVVGIKGSPKGSAQIFKAQRNHHLRVHLRIVDKLGDTPTKESMRLVDEPGKDNPEIFEETYEKAKTKVEWQENRQKSSRGSTTGTNRQKKGHYDYMNNRITGQKVYLVKPIQNDRSIEVKEKILSDLETYAGVRVNPKVNFITNCHDPEFFKLYANDDGDDTALHIRMHARNEKQTFKNLVGQFLEWKSNPKSGNFAGTKFRNRMICFFMLILKKGVTLDEQWFGCCGQKNATLYRYLAMFIQLLGPKKMFSHYFVEEKFPQENFRVFSEMRGKILHYNPKKLKKSCQNHPKCIQKSVKI